MKIKMIVTDMDGTLLDERGELDRPRLSRILDGLQERGIRFVVATGNEIPRLRLILGDLLDRMTLIVANGARIFQGEELLLSSFWEPELVQDFLAYMAGREQEVHLTVAAESGSFVQEGTDFPLLEKVMSPEMAELFYQRMHFVPSLQEQDLGRVIKMGMMVHEAMAEPLSEEINTRFAGRLSAVTSGYGAIDIIQNGVHKAWGLEQLLELWGAAAGDMMAFGDSANDLEMLELAGLSYAMDNAPAVVKAAADRIAPSNSQAGVYRVLEAFLEEES